ERRSTQNDHHQQRRIHPRSRSGGLHRVTSPDQLSRTIPHLRSRHKQHNQHHQSPFPAHHIYIYELARHGSASREHIPRHCLVHEQSPNTARFRLHTSRWRTRTRQNHFHRCLRFQFRSRLQRSRPHLRRQAGIHDPLDSDQNDHRRELAPSRL